ncbi:MAG: polyphosphate kinase 1, partial [Bacteroidota bacterium]
FIVGFEKADQPPVLVKLPTAELGRFVLLPSGEKGHFIAFLDDLVRLSLPAIFPKKKIKGAWSVKLSRDADLYIDDEYSGDLLDKIKQGLEERHVGLPTRFLYDAAMPKDLLDQVSKALKLSKNDLIPGARYHNFNDFFAFPNPAGLQELHYEPMPPLPHPALENVPSLLAAMQERDYVLHFPYQKFDYVTRFIEEAAADEQVESVKITLYRVAGKSAVCEALLKTLEAGKKVTVFIEAKARFDEESNLQWGERLEKAGATVRYSFPGIKVHTKLLLVSRRNAAQSSINNHQSSIHFAYLGTGNFNEKTALLYADHALLTADKRLTDEAAQVFDLLEGKLLLPKCKHLLVSPFTLREKFVDMIDREIENARDGKDAWMVLKMNSLEDKPMAEKLIEASKAGVKIQLIIRGICILTPGIAGETENIEIISILDRFLEHARVYLFADGGKEKMYLSSADWMHRNLDRRVEVAFPIYDENLRQEIRQIIDFQLADNCKARILEEKNSNSYKKRKSKKFSRILIGDTSPAMRIAS